MIFACLSACVPPADHTTPQATEISPREFNELAPTFLMEVQTNQTLEKTHTHALTNREDRVDCVRYLSPVVISIIIIIITTSFPVICQGYFGQTLSRKSVG